MSKQENIIGKVFTFLTVVGRSNIKRGGTFLIECSCKCGNTTYSRLSHLNSGKIKSCGCYKQMLATRHGYDPHAISNRLKRGLSFEEIHRYLTSDVFLSKRLKIKKRNEAAVK